MREAAMEIHWTFSCLSKKSMRSHSFLLMLFARRSPFQKSFASFLFFSNTEELTLAFVVEELCVLFVVVVFVTKPLLLEVFLE